MIGPERRRHITSIEVIFRGPCASDAFGLLDECTRLRKLWIQVNWETTRFTKAPQKNLFLARGAGALKKIRGLKDLDLRVRESQAYALTKSVIADVELLFETELKSLQSVAQGLDISTTKGSKTYQTLCPNYRKYDLDHVEEFERVLREEMGKDREPARGNKGHSIVGADTPSAGDANVQNSGKSLREDRVLRSKRMSKLSQGRVSRKSRAIAKRHAKRPAERTRG